MMIEILIEKTPKANKQHKCMASYFILDHLGYVDFTFADLREIVKAKKQGYKILKGQKYLRQHNKCDGEIYAFKAIPEMHEICLKYGLYEQ